MQPSNFVEAGRDWHAIGTNRIWHADVAMPAKSNRDWHPAPGFNSDRVIRCCRRQPERRPPPRSRGASPYSILRRWSGLVPFSPVPMAAPQSGRVSKTSLSAAPANAVSLVTYVRRAARVTSGTGPRTERNGDGGGSCACAAVYTVPKGGLWRIRLECEESVVSGLPDGRTRPDACHAG